MADPARGPLTHLRVLDLAGEAGVFVGRQLAELGADVIRIEPPGGDDVRRRGPFLAGEEDLERSLYHFHFNLNKRGITLDITRPEGAAVLKRLTSIADVLIETRAPGEMDGLGVGYEALRSVNPGLIYTTITPFGQHGPMSDYHANDLIGAAMSGLMYLNGYEEDPPNLPGAEQAYHMASLVAVSATLIALAGRERDPQHAGHRVDISMQEATSMATLQTANANIYTWHGGIPRRTGLEGLGGPSLYQCRDGQWLSFTVPIGAPLLWDAFVEWLQEEGIDTPVTGEEWRDPAYRLRHPGVASEAIAELTKRHDRAELFHEGQRRRMLVLPVNNVKDLLEDEQLRTRDYFVAVEHPGLDRTFKYPGAPYHFSETPAHGDRRAPLLGEHNEEVYGDLLGMSASERKQLETEGVV